LLKIDDIVDFRTSMRGKEVAGAVYIVSEEGGELRILMNLQTN